MSLSTELLEKSQSDRQADSSTVKLQKDWRWPVSTWIMTVLCLVMGLIAQGVSVVSFKDATTWFEISNWNVPAKPTILILTVLCALGAGGATKITLHRGKSPAWLAGLVGMFFLVALLLFVVAGNKDSVMPLVALLHSTLALAIPLVFGSMSGLVCERTGVINIAIEGQLLLGAFLGAVVASTTKSPYLGLIGAPIAGALVAVLLALFTIKYRVDHIIVGVVLNMLVVGLTSFLYSTWLKNNEAKLNHPTSLDPLAVPILSDIPVIGPVLFKQSLLVYLMYVVVVVLNIAIFRSRWGLRSRACGEHPRAADTVGINVNLYRWRNVLIGGALAGLGGAYFTIGAGLAFTKDMAAGNGFIALAAMILGKWNPKGAVAASLLFAFATALGYVMQSASSPIPTEFLLMIPYLVTILAVAGFVGRVRPPAMEGKPYPL
ncbi:ABC transporter permease [Mobiluncus mulieris]|uniref:ABC transporter permease n=1 Tax=Mobiluncus mulieris TaxID=2052 RepID=UPI00242BFAC6|nr:ABC transporter permease [Mobiluncus mulieris]